ncbi:protein of unknown function [Pseudomonas sp. JV551A1]|nr:protein of unknown function [Pseudomonas sp. JV551A1]
MSVLAQRQKVAGLAGSARRHFLMIWGADNTPLGGISGEALAFLLPVLASSRVNPLPQGYHCPQAL